MRRAAGSKSASSASRNLNKLTVAASAESVGGIHLNLADCHLWVEVAVLESF